VSTPDLAFGAQEKLKQRNNLRTKVSPPFSGVGFERSPTRSIRP
jgi:hypothetical protein